MVPGLLAPGALVPGVGAPGAMAMLLQQEERPEPLFDAVTRGDLEEIKQLLRSQCDVNESTGRGSHVIFRAVMKAQGPEVVRLLLDVKADVQRPDDKGNSVMHVWARATAGRNHLVAIGESLVRRRADVNAQRTADGMSPLHHVVIGHNNRRGWLDFHKALFLLRHGADPGLSTRQVQRPCDLLATDGRASTRKLARLLLCNGAGGPWPRCEQPDCAWCN